MLLRKNSPGDPLTRAAGKALETGNADYILIWIPEESENTLRNLLEKACCDRTIRRKAQDQITDWYFKTVGRMHSSCYGPYDLNLSTKTPEEKKIILLVESSCQNGNFKEISTAVPDTSSGEMQRQFNIVMSMNNFDPENTAAGRAWVSAFTGFVALVNQLHSGSR